MCAPSGSPGSQQRSNTAAAATGGSAALKIVGSIADFVSQGQAYKANAERAVADFSRTVDALGVRSSQVQESTAENILDIALQGARARSASKVGAAAAGLSGTTMRALSQGIDVQQSTVTQRVLRNEQNELSEIRRDLSGATISAQNRIDSVSRGSPLNLALQIGSAVTEAASSGNF